MLALRSAAQASNDSLDSIQSGSPRVPSGTMFPSGRL